MAKQRYINTRFWSDGWIQNIDPIEKLLFLYLLTNERTNIAGVYELPLKIMAVETGIDIKVLSKIFQKFKKDKKIEFYNGWIIIINFIKHQAINPKIEKGIAYFIQNEIPDYIMERVLKINPEIEYYEEVYLPESRKKNVRNILKEIDKCEDCSKEFNIEELEVHHKTPLFKGGNNNRDNLKILCKKCHQNEHQKIGYDSLSKPSNYYNTNTNTNTNIIGDTSVANININPLIAKFKEINPSYEKLFKNTTQRAALERLVKKWGTERINEVIDILPKTNLQQYAPTITTPLQLEDKLGSLVNFLNRKKNNNKDFIAT